MTIILLFLFVLALLCSIKHYKLAMFIFPDCLKVTRFQGFLASLGWLNLFVSLPFLWDLDFKQGLYPLVIGVLSLAVGIYLCVISNTNKTLEKKGYAHFYLNDDATLIEPNFIEYGFLSGAKARIAALGPKMFFKELFVRDKDLKSLAKALVKESVADTENQIRTLPYVVDNAVSLKTQFFLIQDYIVNYYDKAALLADSDVYLEHTLDLCKRLEISFNEIPFKIARFIACVNLVANYKGKISYTKFAIDVDKYIGDEEENVLLVFNGKFKTLDPNLGKIVKATSLLLNNFKAKHFGKLVITNKKAIMLTDTKEQLTYSLESLKQYRSVLNYVSFDSENYCYVDDMSLFEAIVKYL